MKHIRTTICLSPHLLAKLFRVYEKKRDAKFIMNKAAKFAAKKYSRKSERRCVKYQSFQCSFVRMHIVIPMNLYEVLTDARSCAKKSVSGMISDSLEIILNNENSTLNFMMDNHHDYAYKIKFFPFRKWNYTIVKWKIIK